MFPGPFAGIKTLSIPLTIGVEIRRFTLLLIGQGRGPGRMIPEKEQIMDAYAVIETGGKQYRVRNKEVISVERLDVEAGAQITFDRVLAVSNGKELIVGTPTVEAATINATVMEHYRGPKVVSFKFKRRKGYKRKQGHRQELTRVKIQTFMAEDETPAEAAE